MSGVHAGAINLAPTMRLLTATVTANTEIYAGVHLIEMHAPQLAQTAQPGQYCMVRCCDALASDPLLRRPFFIHTVQRARGVCTLLIALRGRGTSWLVKQQEGAALDILGPLGHGWVVGPTVRNLLLISEGVMISAVTLLAQQAIEQELAVTLVNLCAGPEEIYPAVLLPAEVEYHVYTPGSNPGQDAEERAAQARPPRIPTTPTLTGRTDHLLKSSIVPPQAIGNYFAWADAACCSVSHGTSQALYQQYERVRQKHFAQGIVLRPLVCGGGICLACTIETLSGPKLACRDGPVFDLGEIVALRS